MSSAALPNVLKSWTASRSLSPPSVLCTVLSTARLTASGTLPGFLGVGDNPLLSLGYRRARLRCRNDVVWCELATKRRDVAGQLVQAGVDALEPLDEFRLLARR